MTDRMMPFEFDGNRIRVHLDENGEPRFVVADVAAVFGYATTGHATRLLRDDEKGTQIVGTLGGRQQMAMSRRNGGGSDQI